jgi:hypothetical protein
LRHDFESDVSNASIALELVAAHMCLAQYAEAEKVCVDAEAARRKDMSISEFPVQRGTAQWCQHRFDDAESTWWSAANAKYGDAAGANVHYLLLLAADGLLKGELSASVREAMDKKTTDARAHHNWPGQIAMFLLGVYGASFVVAAAYDRVARWQFDFLPHNQDIFASP